MESIVKKWGNSLALKIPGFFCRQSGMTEGSRVNISLKGNSLDIKLVRPKYKLDELLEQVNESNLHGEIWEGTLKGREIW